MAGRVTFRSAFSILTSLSSTAIYAGLATGMWLFVWSRATGTDWLLVYALPAVAILLIALPLLQRFTVAPDGLVVTNLVARARIPWEEVAEVRVERMHMRLFIRFDVWVPGIVVTKTNDLMINAYATCGLRAAARRRLGAAIAAAAAQHGFHSEVTADALARRAPREAEAPPGDPLDDTRWDEDPDLVECVFCGRRAGRDEMTQLDQPGDPPAWHCRDESVCTEGEEDTRAAVPS